MDETKAGKGIRDTEIKRNARKFHICWTWVDSNAKQIVRSVEASKYTLFDSMKATVSSSNFINR